MTVIEVHPEELLDRELRGTLTERQHQLLAAHLKRCSACRMERQLRADFERELSVPAQALDLQMFVSGAMRAIETPGSSTRRGIEARGTRRSKRQRWSGMQRAAAIMVACAALSAGAGIATAQFGLAERAWRLVRESVEASLSRPTRAPARTPPARHAPSEASRETPVAPPPALGVPPVRVAAKRAELARAAAPISRDQHPAAKNPVLPPTPRSVSAPASAPAAPQQRAPGLPPRVAAPLARESIPAILGSRARGRASTDARGSAREQNPAKQSIPDGASAPSESPAVLFEKANVVRRRGHGIEASGLYRELQARYPHSAEARLSVAVVARMQLDRGENRAAFLGFEAYLASSDLALQEEAMVGRVRALSRLERARDARAAARDLLDVYPQSAFAPQARRLLESPAP